MTEIIDIFKQLGTTTAICLMIAFILVKRVIPYWIERDQRAQAFREKQWDRAQNLQESVMREISTSIQANNMLTQRVGGHIEASTVALKELHKALTKTLHRQ